MGIKIFNILVIFLVLVSNTEEHGGCENIGITIGIINKLILNFSSNICCLHRKIYIQNTFKLLYHLQHTI